MTTQVMQHRQNHSSSGTRVRALGGAVLLVAGILVGCSTAPDPKSAVSLPAEVVAARTALQHVLDLTTEAIIAPGTDPRADTVTQAPLPTAAEVDTLTAATLAKLAPLTSGKAVGELGYQVRTDLQSLLTTGTRELGGGVEDLTIGSWQVPSANSVLLSGTVVKWGRIAQVREDGTLATAEPHNQLDYTATLVRSGIDSPWTLDAFTWGFSPGHTP